MISKAQDRWYWRMWAAVQKFCKAHAITVPDRHDLHRRALGRDVSHKDFTDDDFDDVMSAFYSIAEPDNLEIQIRFTNMRRTRALHACRRNAARACKEGAENYIAAIARDKFGKSDWETLELEQLRDLRNTLSARGKTRNQ